MSYHSIFRPDLFKGQTIIVTGSGSGIGRCIAHELVSLGARVVLVGRRLEKLERVAGEIEAEGGVAVCYACDIRDEERVQEVVGQMVAKFGVIHGLVNNAGGQFPAPLETISGKGFDAVVRNNLTGGFLMAREVYLNSMQKNGGAIVNILADFRKGMPRMGHSGAARAGMENFTRTAAVEWAVSGVRVNAVAPGWIISSGFDTYDEETQKGILRLHHGVPLKRLGVEAEVSAAVAFLLSEGASFISGATLHVDGAATLAPSNYELPDHNRSQPYEGFHLTELPALMRNAKEAESE